MPSSMPTRVGLMLAIEGLSSFRPDGWLIDVLWQLGVRMASLGEDFEVAPGIFADSALHDLEGLQDYPALADALP